MKVLILEADEKGRVSMAKLIRAMGDQMIISKTNPTNMKGFAKLSPEQRKVIARKGGVAVSQNREHMSLIGRRGGQVSGYSRRIKAINKPSIVDKEEYRNLEKEFGIPGT